MFKKLLNKTILIILTSIIILMIIVFSVPPSNKKTTRNIKPLNELTNIVNTIINIQATNKNIKPYNSLLESLKIDNNDSNEINKDIVNEDDMEGAPSTEDNIIKDDIDKQLEQIDLNNQIQSKKTSYIIKTGDTLYKILSNAKVNIKDINLLYSNYNKLGNLDIGQKVNWEVDEDHNLLYYSRIIKDNTMESYVKNNDKFEEKVEKINWNWEEISLSGNLDQNNFVSVASEVGLTTDEIKMITSSLQSRLDFKNLNKGDQFNIVLSREMFGTFHNDSKILGVKIKSNNKDYVALLADNGKYYDENGNALFQSFMKIPLNETNIQISSEFNTHRFHPITKRYMPHNGVDFAVKVGTNVLASSDGEIVFAGNSGTAGNMITIRHGRQYVSRYMHLSKINVKVGQKVKMGEIIGLSGNTGRSTGAHLHYEILVDNIPQNPLKMNFDEVKPLAGMNKLVFIKNTKDVMEKLGYSNRDNKLLTNKKTITVGMLLEENG